MAAEVVHWWDMRWFEWLGVIGFPLALLGLWLTWRQAKKATDAANAARVAIGRTQKQLVANQLLVLVPQLRWISTEIDAAIEDNNAGLAKRHMDNWRWQAGNVHGMLTGNSGEDDDLLRDIQAAVSLAAAASGSLLEDVKSPLLKRCSRARGAINGVCDQLNIWVGKHSMEVQETSEASG